MKPKTPIANGRVSKADVQSVLASLKRLSSVRIREEMSSRYGIVTKDAYGVRMRDMQVVAKKLGRTHALALALWDTGNYEARTVAAFVAEPERLTPTLMDRWCRDFDNWAICDTVCFKLFDQSPHALGRAAAWAGQKDEFQRRAAFALLACVALHNGEAEDDAFLKLLPLVEAAATDERNFVKKGVSWGLRGIGGRSKKLEAAAVGLAKRLASSENSTSRWIGEDVLHALTPKELKWNPNCLTLRPEVFELPSPPRCRFGIGRARWISTRRPSVPSSCIVCPEAASGNCRSAVRHSGWRRNHLRTITSVPNRSAAVRCGCC